MPVSGISPDHPARDDEHLEGDDRGEADGEQPAEGVAQGEPGPVAARHQQRVQQEDRGQAGQAEFLARGGQDEVRLGGEADEDGVAEAEAGAEHPAGGEREQRLGELAGALARLDGRRTDRSQSSTRLCTCGSSVPTANAPDAPPAAARPRSSRSGPVATYSMTTKRPKKSSEVPRSRSRTSTPTLISQIATIGPSTRPVGSRSRQIRRPV